ncbi:S49 family peptidase [Candidatus Babeliales bacterium]|nr:S49 family peptidase [Candidatus Babeliales bacterium]
MAKFQEYIKTIFYVLLVLQFTPMVFKTVKKQWKDHVEPKNKVGLVHLDSVICSSVRWNKQLTQFFKDPEIKAILLKIDSPGGAAGATQAICDEILYLKQKYPKPIVAYIENVGASGGYQVAAATEYIVATASALIGSIGCKLNTQIKIKEFLQNYKIQTHEFVSSVYKNAGDPLSELNSEQVKMLQAVVDQGAQDFENTIAQLRHLDLAQKATWAEGKIFSGTIAWKLKLIDAVGNQRIAIEFIKGHILHEDREVELIKVPGPSKLQKMLGLATDDCDQDEDMQNSFTTSLWRSLLYVLQTQEIRY